MGQEMKDISYSPGIFSCILRLIFLIIGLAKYRDRPCRDIMASPPLQLFKTQLDRLTWLGVL